MLQSNLSFKRLILFILFISSVFIFSFQSENDNSSKNLGQDAFNILQKMDNISIEDFMNSLLTIQDIREYSLDSELVTEELKLTIARRSDESYNKYLKRNYRDLKYEGEKHKITFSKIEFGDFECTPSSEDGFKNCEGFLTFIHKGINYEVKVQSFYTGEKYAITGIQSLKSKP